MIPPILALTMGDPAGVGPELALKAIGHPRLRNRCRLLLLGDARHLYRVEGKIQKGKKLQRIPLFPVSSIGRVPGFFTESDTALLDFNNVPAWQRLGSPSKAGGKASGDYIQAAVQLAIEGKVQAMVTGPINKLSFRMGGWGKRYTGHTEMLAALTRSRTVALMMVTGALRAVHVTSHIPLKQVARVLTKKRIVETILLTYEGLRRLGFRRPRIAVAALNPHGGEDGIMGNEEKTLIEPAVRWAKKEGMNVTGPLPADTLWPQVKAGRFDAGVAMYHDQGQIPVKLLGMRFRRDGGTETGGVNVTLGLPIIRTSVAHGTAYDIAGRGVASEESLIQALHLASQMAQNKYGHQRA